MRRKIHYLVGVIGILLLVGCGSNLNMEELSEWSSTPENATLGFGRADYNNGFLYYMDNFNIFEYDLLTGKSVKYDVQTELLKTLPPEMVSGPNFINAVEDGVLFNISYRFPIRKLAFDDQKVSIAYSADEISLWTNSYVEGDYIFGIDGFTLKRFDTRSGEVKILAERVLQYCKEKDVLYYVAETEADPNLMEVFVLEDGKKTPKKIDVGMNPITVCEEGGKLYLSEYDTWQLYSYDLASATLEKLEGANSVSYQVRGDRLFYGEVVYSDVPEEATMCNLYYRDLRSGEDILLKERVQTDVCVFSEDAVVCFEYNFDNWDPHLIRLDGDKVEDIKLPLF